MLISSPHNPTVKLIQQLLTSHRYRKKNALSVVEGTHLIDASLKANYPIKQLLISNKILDKNFNVSTELETTQHHEITNIIERCQAKNIPIITIESHLYQDIRTLGTGIDIMAIIPITSTALSDNIEQDCLILNDVQDSGNVGTLLRTAAAIGINNIICTANTASVWSPKALRAGMGGQFSLTIYEKVSLDDLINNIQVPMMATSSHTDQTIYQTDLSNPVAWVMGHEGQGVCSQLLEQATPVTIPQPNGQESLNVAIAGALCMYEMLRQRLY